MELVEAEKTHGLVKLSIAFEPEDYSWARARAEELFGRRGIGTYVRTLIRHDKVAKLKEDAAKVLPEVQD